MEELTRILAACSPVLALVAGWAAGQLRSVHKKDRAMENGVKMLLRAKLIDKCLHYIEKGSVPPFALETIKGLYQSYLELGDGDPLVVHPGRLNYLADQIADHRDGRHARNPKVHSLTLP